MIARLRIQARNLRKRCIELGRVAPPDCALFFQPRQLAVGQRRLQFRDTVIVLTGVGPISRPSGARPQLWMASHRSARSASFVTITRPRRSSRSSSPASRSTPSRPSIRRSGPCTARRVPGRRPQSRSDYAVSRWQESDPCRPEVRQCAQAYKPGPFCHSGFQTFGSIV